MFDLELLKLKISEFKKVIEKEQRTMKINDRFLFSDGTLMYRWLNKENQKINKFLKSNEELNNEKINYIIIFSTFRDYLYEFNRSDVIGDYENLVAEYYIKVSELGRKIIKEDNLYFSNGINMYNWYLIEEKKLQYELDNNIIPYNKRLEKIKLFSKIDKYLMDKLEKNKKELYIRKCNEYLIKHKTLDNITKEDKFFDGSLMNDWFNEQLELKKINKLKYIDLFNNLLQELNNYSFNMNKQFIYPKIDEETNEYLEKCNIYKEMIVKLNRNLYKVDDLYFDDGQNMKDWYEGELVKQSFFKTKYNELTKESIIKYDSFKILKTFIDKNYGNISFEEKCSQYKKIDKNDINGEIKDWITYFFNKFYREENFYKIRKKYSNEFKIFEELIKSLELIKKVSFDEKCELYLNEIIKRKRHITKEDNLYFLDNERMDNWIQKLSVYSIKHKNDKKLSDEVFYKLLKYAELENILNSTKGISFKQKCSEYIEKTKEIKRIIREVDHYVFSDNTDMYRWYSSKKKYFKKINNNSKEKYQKRKIMFEEVENEVRKYNKTIDSNEEYDKEEVFQKKYEEYIKKINELQRNIVPDDNLKFSTGQDMLRWYNVNNNSQRNNFKKNKYSEKDIARSYCLAKIEDLIRSFDNENIFLKKCEEFISTIKEIKSYIPYNDKSKYKFSDGTLMYNWFLRNKNNLLDNSIKKEKIFIEKMNEIINLINQYDKRSNYEIRCLEYIKKLEEQNYIITSKDKFSDGVEMSDWYNRQHEKYTNIRKKEKCSPKNFEMTKMFAEVENKIIEYKNNIFNDYCKEYIEQIREIKRNIISSDNYNFKDGKNMYNWYKQTKNKIEINKINYIYSKNITKFKKIDDLINDFEDEKFYNRCLEYKEKLIKNDYKITQDDKFSDDSSMLKWYKMNESEFEKYKFLELKNDKSIRKAIIFIEIEDLIFEYNQKIFIKKCKEFKEKLLEVGIIKMRKKEDFFEDGTLMFNWYKRQKNQNMNPTKKEHIDEIEKIILEQEHEVFIRRKEEYIKKCKKIKRKINKYDNFYFSDGAFMHTWYAHLDDKDIENIQENLKEINDIDFLRKKQEYFLKCKKIARKVNNKDKFRFKDGTDMFTWYSNVNSQIIKARNNEECTSKDIEKAYEMAEIDDYLYDQELILFLDRCNQYCNYIIKNGNKPTSKTLFEDGSNMYNWYTNIKSNRNSFSLTIDKNIKKKKAFQKVQKLLNS